MMFDLYDYRPEDGGILDAWCDLYAKDWLYVTGYECWYRWHNTTHWARDEEQRLQEQIQTLMDAMNKAAIEELGKAQEFAKEAREKPGSDIATEMAESAVRKALAYIAATKRTKARVNSVEGMAQAQRAIAAGALDAGNVLNLRNGTLNLDTLELRPHDPADHLTYCLTYNYDPQALAPRFEQFIQQVLGDHSEDGEWQTDDKLCELIQAALGYSLTNDMSHEVMFWLSGTGGNGKSVLIKLVQKLLGRNAFSMNFSLLGTTDGNYRLAELVGKRVVFCTESQRNSGVAEELMKQIADGSYIDARPIHGKPINFQSQAKIWWAMNDKPIIRDTGKSFWRRLKLIPFNRTFTEKDRDINLYATLENELPGILNFALNGLRQLREWGRFPEVAAVAKAISEYQMESNVVAQWMEERTVKLKNPVTLSTALYNDYKIWSDKTGHEGVFNKINFGKELRRLQVPFKENTRDTNDKVGNCYALGLIL